MYGGDQRRVSTGQTPEMLAGAALTSIRLAMAAVLTFFPDLGQ